MATTPAKDEPARARTIRSARHPVARRVADVLRSRSEKPKVFVLDDPENIEQAVTAGIELDSLYVTESVLAGGFTTLAGVGPDVPLNVLEDAVARTLFGEQKSARTFALARAPRPPRLHDLTGTPGDVVVLDGVRIIGNIGAIARTACALGAAGVIVVDSGLRTVLDRRLIRASRGLVFAIPIVLTSRAACADFIQREGLTAVSLSAEAAEPLSAIRAAPDRLAVVLGGERGGVSSELDTLAAHGYAIPMTPSVESLNVSVAAGIALYEHQSGRRRIDDRGLGCSRVS